MCDYAVGLSRQLSGSIIPSEREHPAKSQTGLSNIHKKMIHIICTIG